MSKKNKKKNKSQNYGMVGFLRVSALIIPLPVYLLFTVFLFPAPNSGFLVLGIVGSFAIGIGLMNIAGLYDDNYFGHAVTAIFLGIGSLLILVSSLIMYVPSIYSKFDERYVTLYYLVWTALAICAIWYVFFRGGVKLHIRGKGVSKTTIEKSLKGNRNFWWYEQAHTEFDLGWIYYLNKGFTVLFPFVGLLHLLLGWIRIMSIISAAGCCLLCVMCEPMWVLATMSARHLNIPDAKRKQSGISTLAAMIFPAMMCVTILIYLFKYL